MAFNVRQGGYKTVHKKAAISELRTENVWCCTALFGIDRVNGTAFLCHQDVPWRKPPLHDIAADLAKNGTDLKNCQLYMLTSYSPWLCWLLALVAYQYLPLLFPLPLLGNETISLFAALILLTPVLTRLRMRWQLRRLKASTSYPPMIITGRPLMKCGVKISAATGCFDIDIYGKPREAESFKPNGWKSETEEATETD